MGKFKKGSSVEINKRRKDLRRYKEWSRNHHRWENPHSYKWRIRLSKECDILSKKLNAWMDAHPRQRPGKTWDRWTDMFTLNIYPGFYRNQFSIDRVKYKGMVSLKNIDEILESYKYPKRCSSWRDDE
jgi:hypothetical protein